MSDIKPNERKIIRKAINEVFDKYIIYIDCIFWKDDDIADKTIFLIRAIIYSYVYSYHISSFTLKDDEFIDKEINRIKSQLKLLNTNQYPEEQKQYFILYSLILLILDYANLLDDEEDNNNGGNSGNNTTNKNTTNNNNKNTTNNNHRKESLKLLIYLMQNSLYKYIYKNNNKLILIDLSKLKLLLNDTKTKDYFVLLLSNLKLEYILDFIVYVDKNFINNYIEYSNIRNNIKNDIKEINGRINNNSDINNVNNTKETNSLIRHIRRAIKFIKDNLIPLLLLSKLVTDVAKTMLQQSITKTKDNNLDKSKTPSKTTNKFFGIINRLFGNKVRDKDNKSNKNNKDKKDIETEKPEFEYIELDPNILNSMFDNAVIKSAEKVILVKPEIEINLNYEDFKTISSLKKPRTKASIENYILTTQTSNNSEGKSNINYAKVHDKVSNDEIVDNENEDDLDGLINNEVNETIDKNENKNGLINFWEELSNKKISLSNLEPPSKNNNNPNPEDENRNTSNPNLEEDNSTEDEQEEPSIEPEEDSTKNPSDPNKTPPDDDNDPNKPTKHKIRKPDIGGRGM